MSYYEKYLKYKNKYLELKTKKQTGGGKNCSFSGCPKESNSLFTCPKCHNVSYCSINHLMKDRNTHNCSELIKSSEPIKIQEIKLEPDLGENEWKLTIGANYKGLGIYEGYLRAGPSHDPYKEHSFKKDGKSYFYNTKHIKNEFVKE